MKCLNRVTAYSINVVLLEKTRCPLLDSEGLTLPDPEKVDRFLGIEPLRFLNEPRSSNGKQKLCAGCFGEVGRGCGMQREQTDWERPLTGTSKSKRDLRRRTSRTWDGPWLCGFQGDWVPKTLVLGFNGKVCREGKR